MVLEAHERLRRAKEALRAAEDDAGLPRPVPGSPRGVARSDGVFHVSGGNGRLLRALAEALPEGGWAGIVGINDLGWEAAAKKGIDLSRILVIPQPLGDGAQVCSLLLEALDLVCADGELIAPPARRRLAALARSRRRILLTTTRWAGLSRPWRACAEPGAAKAIS